MTEEGRKREKVGSEAGRDKLLKNSAREWMSGETGLSQRQDQQNQGKKDSKEGEYE